MPFVYLPEVDSVMVRITKAASTSIIRSGFNTERFGRELAMEFPSEWEEKFRFAFIRNPFERLVSAWQMFSSHPMGKEAGYDTKSLTLEKVLRVVEDDSIEIYGNDYWSKLKRHAMPIMNPHYRIAEVDFLGRYETLETDWRTLCKLLGIGNRPLEHLKNSRRTAHYSYYFDNRTRELASQIYADDLEVFEYRFEDQLHSIQKAA